jgi:hypothetical protein
MTPAFRRLALLAALIALGAAPGESTKPSPPAITISKQTTYITEPLRKDGSVDYVAALDRLARQGVTPENNAAVPFWQAMGPGDIRKEDRNEYFRRLGIPPPPEQGNYFVNFKDFYTLHNDAPKPQNARSDLDAFLKISGLLTPALDRPWSKQEFPLIAAWLESNERPLTSMTEASRRPRLYDPLVGGESDSLIAIYQPAFSAMHDVAETFQARAMLRLHENNLDAVWEDLLTCHRLARLLGQGPKSMNALTARSCEEKACSGDLILLQNPALTASQIIKIRRDLDRLPPLPTIGDKLDVGERFEYLDMLRSIARGGLPSLAMFTIFKDGRALKKTVNLLAYYGKSTPIDWDVSFRMANDLFDRLAAANRRPTRQERKEAFRKIKTEMSDLKKSVADSISLEKAVAINPRQALSERLGQVCIVSIGPDGAVHSCLGFEEENLMRFELVKLSFALAAYRADRGAYPVKLGDLKPQYIAKVPKDICTDGQLHYRRQPNGFLLYSIGSNGRDDGAKSTEDRNRDLDYDELVKRGQDWDDLVVRVPALNPNQKKPPEKTELSPDDSLRLKALAEKIRQSVKELEYSDQTAQGLAEMATGWKTPGDKLFLLALDKKLRRARRDYEKHNLTKAEMAGAEKKIVDELADDVRFSVFDGRNCCSLEDVVEKREANCCGFSQLFYVLGNSLGLRVKMIWVPEIFTYGKPPPNPHAACLVGLADGNVIMADLAQYSISEPFLLRRQYRRVGNYLELQDHKNLLGLHPSIQLLNVKGIIGCNYYNKSVFDVKAKHYPQALAKLTMSIKLNPNCDAAYRNLAVVHLEMKLYNDTVDDCAKAIALNPNISATYYFRGYAYHQLNKYDQAVADFTKTLELNPRDAKALFMRGAVYARQGKKPEALADWEKAVKLDPPLKEDVKKCFEEFLSKEKEEK